jgi:CBS domain containing-hemolysin-like protein
VLTTLFRREIGRFDHWLTVIVVTLAYLVLGRALPKAIATGRPSRSTGLVLALATLFSAVVWPLSVFGDAVGRLLTRYLRPGGQHEPAPVATEQELRTISLPDEDDGIIEIEEREMIDGVLHLEETAVRDIMVPRIDIVAVERSVPPAELVETITRAGHSRIPVYDDSVDQIVGILYAKDLLPFVLGTTDALPLTDLLRPPYVVPESKRVDLLLTDMRRQKVHIAIVVDEYGGTAGLVTIEDILEEIVGEIQDEYDTEEPLFVLTGEAALLADGRLPLTEVEDALGVEFDEDEDYATLGGFIQKHLGRLPRAGDEFEAEGVRVAVLLVERHRVRQARLTKVEPATTETPTAAAPLEVAAVAGDVESHNS